MTNEQSLESRESDYQGMALQELEYAKLEDFYGKTQTYKLDMLTPDRVSSAPRPLVLLIHGGGFVRPCTKRQFYIPILARYLTEKGYAVAAPDYPVYETEKDRNSGNAGMLIRKPARAVGCALDFLKKHAESFGLDGDRVAVMGGSAGGMTAFYAAAERKHAFRALVNLWGAPDPLPNVDGFPPVLSVHGTEDVLVPFEREKLVQDALSAAEVPHRLIALEGCGHTPIDRADVYMPEILKFLNAAFRDHQ